VYFSTSCKANPPSRFYIGQTQDVAERLA